MLKKWLILSYSDHSYSLSMMTIVVVDHIGTTMMTSVMTSMMRISDNDSGMTRRMLVHGLSDNSLLGIRLLITWLDDHLRLNHWLDIGLLRRILLLHGRVLLLLNILRRILLLLWVWLVLLLLLHRVSLGWVLLLLLDDRLLIDRFSVYDSLLECFDVLSFEENLTSWFVFIIDTKPIMDAMVDD